MNRNKIIMPLLLKKVQTFILPMAGICCFLLLWSLTANSIETSLGKFPGPSAVATQMVNLVNEHNTERDKEKAFYIRQDERNEARMAKDPSYQPKVRMYTGKETFLDQIVTSLITVLSGFLVAAIIAIPLGIAIGLSKNLNRAINPIIQVFKPVSPLAWLPLVTMVVSAVYVSPDPMFAKSFVNSLITVTLCSLWPMVINTSFGVVSMNQDWVNVSKVLSLPKLVHIQKIVLPASVPAIFTGMRMSLGIAWMVLIAAEMLAQNPGLGKFVWDEFQNGSSQSLSRIMTAVIVIGLIGYMLDRTMLQLQRMLSWDKSSAQL
ncbi:ABC transporter permease [Colwellia sp. 4_MG-2023]|uniref:ABC transporter permease n=1 Tax=unclassified Colwellia TaxID=196834 RepID=UPI001C0A33ED|nr:MULTISPECIES: ABC transporter permease [unclassified Colwellia]MBU2925741.1 ABC transporter permease [Colwellia sp. C2M11]MDO6505609.1 ABC transporter permease [Colwellia sp. 5_MG-2023]MDO6554095.1 ABC transporter permease [Colwellia sp. 4_MG-2023]MDO6651033.1 ABC transporter permease [Colwellia sp. 3_MG-2023]MDO6664068.1 ABC transporter permease [Colwellia sp. 2_MG-2023]